MKDSFDLAVVGAGSGGLAAAKAATDLGAKVLVVESGRVGGTCVLRGCVPKKIMVVASHFGQRAPLATALGWEGGARGGGGHSWEKLVAQRTRLVNNLEVAHTRQLAEKGVSLWHGRARVAGAHEIDVEGRRARAEVILWATGATPTVPTFAGAELCLDSDAFFALAQRPAAATLIGGGYIACEFAALLAGLGTRVSLLVRRRLLRGFDGALQDAVADGLKQLGVDVRLGYQVEAVRRGSGPTGVEVRARGAAGDVLCLEDQACLLAALGRRPNTADSGLGEAGVRLGPNGAVEVDARHQTACPSIYAIGDVIDRANLTPVAIRAGRTVARDLYGGGAPPMSYARVPRAVFTSPEVGSVGLGEEEARARLGDKVTIYRARFVPLAWSPAPADARPQALTKVVVDSDSDRVVGVHMAGEGAAEVVQGFAAALEAGLTKAQLDATLAVHPTSAEEMVLMRSPLPATRPPPR